MPERRLNDKEVALLMGRIAARQAGAGSPEGVTLSQVRQAAIEMGVDESTFEAAVRDLNSDRSEGSSFWGGPATVHLEQTFDTTVDDSAWPEIVGEIRAASGIIGEATSFGTSLQWSGGDPAFSVTVNSSGGKTTVSVMSKPTEYAIVMYLVGLVVVFTTALVLAAAWHLHFLAGLGLFALCAALGWALVRTGYSAFCRSNQRRAQRIMGRLQNHLMAAETAGQPAVARGEELEPNRIVTG